MNNWSKGNGKESSTSYSNKHTTRYSNPIRRQAVDHPIMRQGMDQPIMRQGMDQPIMRQMENLTNNLHGRIIT